MTYLQLQDQALRATGQTTATSSEPRTRIRAALNFWQRRILADPRFATLLRDSEGTFDTVANQAVYGLGIPMGRLLGISQDLNEATLALRDRAWLRRSDPGLSAIGSPADAYIPRGWFPVQTQPANASSIFAKSSSAADTTQVIDWEFTTSALQRVSGNTTLTGTTALQLGTATTVVEVVKLSLRTAGAGTITVTEDSGAGATLLTVPIGQTFGRFLHVQLWPTPSAVLTYRVDYSREVQDMVQDTDQPLIPPDFQHLLAMGAEYDEWRKLSDDRYSVTYQDIDRELGKLSAHLWDLADDTQGSTVGRSRLGSWFAAGT